MKTHNEKSFNQLVKVGVKEAKPEHYIQMQSYMYLAEPKLTRAFYIAVNKNTDELYGESGYASILRLARASLTGQMPS